MANFEGYSASYESNNPLMSDGGLGNLGSPVENEGSGDSAESDELKKLDTIKELLNGAVSERPKSADVERVKKVLKDPNEEGSELEELCRNFLAFDAFWAFMCGDSFDEEALQSFKSYGNTQSILNIYFHNKKFELTDKQVADLEGINPVLGKSLILRKECSGASSGNEFYKALVDGLQQNNVQEGGDVETGVFRSFGVNPELFRNIRGTYESLGEAQKDEVDFVEVVDAYGKISKILEDNNSEAGSSIDIKSVSSVWMIDSLLSDEEREKVFSQIANKGNNPRLAGAVRILDEFRDSDKGGFKEYSETFQSFDDILKFSQGGKRASVKELGIPARMDLVYAALESAGAKVDPSKIATKGKNPKLACALGFTQEIAKEAKGGSQEKDKDTVGSFLGIMNESKIGPEEVQAVLGDLSKSYAGQMGDLYAASFLASIDDGSLLRGMAKSAKKGELARSESLDNIGDLDVLHNIRSRLNGDAGKNSYFIGKSVSQEVRMQIERMVNARIEHLEAIEGNSNNGDVRLEGWGDVECWCSEADLAIIRGINFDEYCKKKGNGQKVLDVKKIQGYLENNESEGLREIFKNLKDLNVSLALPGAEGAALCAMMRWSNMEALVNSGQQDSGGLVEHIKTADDVEYLYGISGFESGKFGMPADQKGLLSAFKKVERGRDLGKKEKDALGVLFKQTESVDALPESLHSCWREWQTAEKLANCSLDDIGSRVDELAKMGVSVAAMRMYISSEWKKKDRAGGLKFLSSYEYAKKFTESGKREGGAICRDDLARMHDILKNGEDGFEESAKCIQLFSDCLEKAENAASWADAKGHWQDIKANFQIAEEKSAIIDGILEKDSLSADDLNELKGVWQEISESFAGNCGEVLSRNNERLSGESLLYMENQLYEGFATAGEKQRSYIERLRMMNVPEGAVIDALVGGDASLSGKDKKAERSKVVSLIRSVYAEREITAKHKREKSKKGAKKSLSDVKAAINVKKTARAERKKEALSNKEESKNDFDAAFMQVAEYLGAPKAKTVEDLFAAYKKKIGKLAKEGDKGGSIEDLQSKLAEGMSGDPEIKALSGQFLDALFDTYKAADRLRFVEWGNGAQFADGAKGNERKNNFSILGTRALSEYKDGTFGCVELRELYDGVNSLHAMMGDEPIELDVALPNVFTSGFKAEVIASGETYGKLVKKAGKGENERGSLQSDLALVFEKDAGEFKHTGEYWDRLRGLVYQLAPYMDGKGQYSMRLNALDFKPGKSAEDIDIAIIHSQLSELLGMRAMMGGEAKLYEEGESTLTDIFGGAVKYVKENGEGIAQGASESRRGIKSKERVGIDTINQIAAEIQGVDSKLPAITEGNIEGSYEYAVLVEYRKRIQKIVSGSSNEAGDYSLSDIKNFFGFTGDGAALAEEIGKKLKRLGYGEDRVKALKAESEQVEAANELSDFSYSVISTEDLRKQAIQRKSDDLYVQYVHRNDDKNAFVRHMTHTFSAGVFSVLPRHLFKKQVELSKESGLTEEYSGDIEEIHDGQAAAGFSAMVERAAKDSASQIYTRSGDIAFRSEVKKSKAGGYVVESIEIGRSAAVKTEQVSEFELTADFRPKNRAQAKVALYRIAEEGISAALGVKAEDGAIDFESARSKVEAIFSGEKYGKVFESVKEMLGGEGASIDNYAELINKIVERAQVAVGADNSIENLMRGFSILDGEMGSALSSEARERRNGFEDKFHGRFIKDHDTARILTQAGLNASVLAAGVAGLSGVGAMAMPAIPVLVAGYNGAKMSKKDYRQLTELRQRGLLKVDEGALDDLRNAKTRKDRRKAAAVLREKGVSSYEQKLLLTMPSNMVSMEKQIEQIESIEDLGNPDNAMKLKCEIANMIAIQEVARETGLGLVDYSSSDGSLTAEDMAARCIAACGAAATKLMPKDYEGGLVQYFNAELAPLVAEYKTVYGENYAKPAQKSINGWVAKRVLRSSGIAMMKLASLGFISSEVLAAISTDTYGLYDLFKGDKFSSGMKATPIARFALGTSEGSNLITEETRPITVKSSNESLTENEGVVDFGASQGVHHDGIGSGELVVGSQNEMANNVSSTSTVETTGVEGNVDIVNMDVLAATTEKHVSPNRKGEVAPAPMKLGDILILASKEKKAKRKAKKKAKKSGEGAEAVNTDNSTGEKAPDGGASSKKSKLLKRKNKKSKTISGHEKFSREQDSAGEEKGWNDFYETSSFFGRTDFYKIFGKNSYPVMPPNGRLAIPSLGDKAWLAGSLVKSMGVSDVNGEPTVYDRVSKMGEYIDRWNEAVSGSDGTKEKVIELVSRIGNGEDPFSKQENKEYRYVKTLCDLGFIACSQYPEDVKEKLNGLGGVSGDMVVDVQVSVSGKDEFRPIECIYTIPEDIEGNNNASWGVISGKTRDAVLDAISEDSLKTRVGEAIRNWNELEEEKRKSYMSKKESFFSTDNSEFALLVRIGVLKPDYCLAGYAGREHIRSELIKAEERKLRAEERKRMTARERFMEEGESIKKATTKYLEKAKTMHKPKLNRKPNHNAKTRGYGK